MINKLKLIKSAINAQKKQSVHTVTIMLEHQY